jgi:hypothetical protein
LAAIVHVMTRKRMHRLLQDFERSIAGAAPSVDLPHAVQDDDVLAKKFVEAAGQVLERRRKHPKSPGESSSSHVDEINRLLAAKSTLQKEVAARPDAPIIVSSLQELRNVYLYGLQTVSELQDLQDAPDAILPGNFIVPSERAV